MFPSEENLRSVTDTDLHLLLDFQDPEDTVPDLELPQLTVPGPGPGLRPALHRHLPRPPPGELLVHVRQGEVPVLNITSQ